MKTPCLAVVAVPAFVLAIAFVPACTNDSSAVIPAGAGNVIGGSFGGGGGAGASGAGSGSSGASGSGGSTESPPTDGGSSSTPQPGTGGDDANAPRPDPPDAGGITQQDAGSSGGFGVDGQVPVIDSGTPPTGPLGSCSNPACGTDGNECGCQATDSQGNTVQLGCQAGGLCACFVNGNQDTNAFDENGACNSQSAAEQQLFLQYCTQSCN